MTEKDYNPEQKNAKAIKQQAKAEKIKSGIVKAPIEEKVEVNKDIKTEEKSTAEKTKKEKVVAPTPKGVPRDISKEVSTKGKKAPAKTEVAVNAKSVPVSTKYAINICRFIKNKSIAKAMEDLEEVIKMRRAVPMRGEHAHKKSVKGLASGAGRYPVDAAKHFIVILKSLRGNANNHDLENPIITTAMANQASTPFGRFGRWSRKRTHVTLRAKSKKDLKKIKTPKGVPRDISKEMSTKGKKVEVKK